MEEDIKDLMELLKEMGAENIEFKSERYFDDELIFKFNNKKIIITAVGAYEERGIIAVEISRPF